MTVLASSSEMMGTAVNCQWLPVVTQRYLSRVLVFHIRIRVIKKVAVLSCEAADAVVVVVAAFVRIYSQKKIPKKYELFYVKAASSASLLLCR